MFELIREKVTIGLDEVDNYSNPNIVLHFKRLDGQAEWFIVAGDKQSNTLNDWLFFGVGDIIVREMGFFSLSEILKYDGVLDLEWTPVPLYDII